MSTETETRPSGVHVTRIAGYVEGAEARKLEPWCQFYVIGDDGNGTSCRDPEHATPIRCSRSGAERCSRWR
jgi:hypothetical protein